MLVVWAGRRGALADDLAEGVGAATEPVGALAAHVFAIAGGGIDPHRLGQRLHDLPLGRRVAMGDHPGELAHGESKASGREHAVEVSTRAA